MARQFVYTCDTHGPSCKDGATVKPYPFLWIEETTQEPLEDDGETITTYTPRVVSVDVCQPQITAYEKITTAWFANAVPSEEYAASRIGASAAKKSGTGSAGSGAGVHQKYELTTEQVGEIRTWAKSNMVEIDGKQINANGRIGAKWVERYGQVFPEKMKVWGITLTA